MFSIWFQDLPHHTLLNWTAKLPCHLQSLKLTARPCHLSRGKGCENKIWPDWHLSFSCIDTVHTVHPCAKTQEIAPEKQNCSVQITSNYPDPTRENLESQKTVTRRMQAKPQKDIIKPENFGPNIYVMSIYIIHAFSVIDQMHINVITGAGLLASRHQPVAKQYSIISRNAQLQNMSVKLHAVHPSLESYWQTSAELSSHLGCQGAASSSPKILITYLSESWFIVSKSLMENIWKMKNETANGNKTPTLQHFWGPVCTLCRARHKTGRGFSRRIKIIKFASPFFLIKSWHKTNQNEAAAPYSRATSGYLHFGAQPAILADCGVESNFAPFEAWSNSGNSLRSTAVNNQESWTGVVTLVSL